jgi:hypothetical protein
VAACLALAERALPIFLRAPVGQAEARPLQPRSGAGAVLDRESASLVRRQTGGLLLLLLLLLLLPQLSQLRDLLRCCPLSRGVLYRSLVPRCAVLLARASNCAWQPLQVALPLFLLLLAPLGAVALGLRRCCPLLRLRWLGLRWLGLLRLRWLGLRLRVRLRG